MKRFTLAFFLIALSTSTRADHPQAPATLPEAPAAACGFDPERLRRIDERIDRAIAAGQIPGAVVIVGRRGMIVHARAAGRRAVEPAAEPMTRDTIFDMASLTKPVATSTAVMLLVEEGKIRLDDRVAKFLPELDNRGKDKITVEHLLRHRGGLVADNPLKDYEQGPDAAWKMIAGTELIAAPGERFLYSDVGFMILGKLVERVSGRALDEFAAERIFHVAGMADAHFRPLGPVPPGIEGRPDAARIAPTGRSSPRGPILRGVVHDPRARALGGVAGHAGLFATADDLALFAQTLLDGGRAPGGRLVLAPLTVRTMLATGSTPAGERRGLGWDIDTRYSSPRGAFFGPESFGHTGFTGTSLWIDPETQTFVILLTSHLHPDESRPPPTALRAELGTLVAAAIVDADHRGATPAGPPRVTPAGLASRAGSVRCGLDVLIGDHFAILRGQRVGLVTNQTGKSRGGQSTIDVLFHAPGVKLARLFSPEHGIRGDLDATVSDGKDSATGLPIVSLYGPRKKPSAADLEGLDTLVFDIQDVGTRYYTYITTLGLVLEAAREADKRLVVLDRPNPLGGLAVSGPVRDDDLGSFVAYHALPVRHGMTLGELARMYNSERGVGARLEVVPCRGWTRAQTYDQTGLVWINPSPNMRSLAEAMLYPGVGWLEATNLATGRGTDTPFERVGAPWIDPSGFAEALSALGVPGARFVPIWFTPTERQYKGERCGGVQILISEWNAFDPLRLGLVLALTLRRLHPQHWKPEGIVALLGDRATYRSILAGRDAGVIEGLWQDELAAFRKIRSRYLLYDRD